jgi:CRP-like cAMP-binding protein
MSTNTQSNSNDCFKKHTKIRKITKGQHLIREGIITKEVYLVQTGLFRMFYYENDTEICQQFFTEGDIILSVRGFYKQIPSMYIVEALENAEVKILDIKNYFNIENSLTLIEIFGKYLFQKESLELIHAEKNIAFKYDRSIKAFPHLSNRIPQKWIASLLQIHPTTLSKIRNRCSQAK